MDWSVVRDEYGVNGKFQEKLPLRRDREKRIVVAQRAAESHKGLA